MAGGAVHADDAGVGGAVIILPGADAVRAGRSCTSSHRCRSAGVGATESRPGSQCRGGR